jgi:hypothetical protein
MPKIGSPRELKNPALKELRAWPVKGFDETLIFNVGGEGSGKGHSHHGKRDVERILKKESADE